MNYLQIQWGPEGQVGTYDYTLKPLTLQKFFAPLSDRDHVDLWLQKNMIECSSMLCGAPVSLRRLRRARIIADSQLLCNKIV